MKKVLLLTLLVALTACQPRPSGTVRNGMTKSEVVAAWGKPCRSCRGTMETSSGSIWQYDEYLGRTFGHRYSHVYFNRAGIVVGWDK